MPSPRIGDELAGYRIDSLIGRGGMSLVYRAEHLRLRRDVALKVLAPELAEDDRFRERFLLESRLASSINHPHIIPVFDAGEAEGVLFIAMLYVAGTDLKGLMVEESPLDPGRALSILGQAGSALDAAHALGLVHRDVKPANLLVLPRIGAGATDHVYLSDFGLTKQTRSVRELTATGEFMGTLDYIAPEQIQGKPIDGRTDIYALGCVLYELLAGTIPFDKDSDVAVMWAHMHEEPAPITSLRPELPQSLDEVVAKALAKSPEDRYATCAELVGEARARIEGGSREQSGAATQLRARPPEPLAPDSVEPIAPEPYVPPTPVSKPSVGAHATSEARGVIERAEAPATVAEERPEGRRRWMVAGLAVALAGVATVVGLQLASGGDGANRAAGPPDAAPRKDAAGGERALEISRVPGTKAALGGAGDQAMWRAAPGGPGLVGVGYETSGGDLDAAAWTSANGADWTRAPSDPAVLGGPGDQQMATVIAGGPGLVAVGSDGPLGDFDAAVWTSVDGKSWARPTADPAIFGGPGDQVINRVTRGGPGLVAVGYDRAGGDADAAVWTSVAGTVWARATAAPDVFGGPRDQRMRSVAIGGPGLVAVGFETSHGDPDAAVWTSPNGTAWTRIGGSRALFGGAGEQQMATVTAGGPGLVAVGYDGSGGDLDAAVWTSKSGTRWSRVASDPAVFGGRDDQVMNFVTRVGRRLVAVGYSGSEAEHDAAVWTSRDGVGWTRAVGSSKVLGGPGQQEMKGATSFGSSLFVLGWDGPLGELDAAVWKARFGAGR
jgi:hypothetical protein